jgi:hypothetical protein
MASRTAQTDPNINPLAKRYLGISVGDAARKAGLETKSGGPDTLRKFLNQEVSPEINPNVSTAQAADTTAQTSKATIAAKAARDAKKAAAAAQGPEAIDAQTLKGVDDLTAQAGNLELDQPDIPPEARRAALTAWARAQSDKGGIDPLLAVRLGLGAVGGEEGARQDPLGSGEGADPLGRISSGLLGAGAGYMLPSLGRAFYGKGFNNAEQLVENQNKFEKGIDTLNKVQMAGLLSPESMMRHGSSNSGAILTSLLENPRMIKPFIENMRNGGLANAKADFMQGFNSPITEEASGLEAALQKNPIHRTMAGFTNALKSNMGRTGFSPEQIGEYSFTKVPDGPISGRYYGVLQSHPILKNIEPLARIGLNRLSAGIERSPLGLLDLLQADSPEAAMNVVKKAGIGTGVGVAAGALTPQDWVKEHPRTASLIGAMTNVYGLPIAAGMAMGSNRGKNWKSQISGASKAAFKDVPGLRTAQDVLDLASFPKNYLSRYTNVTRPIAEALDRKEGSDKLFEPREVETTSDNLTPIEYLTNRAQAGIPGLRNTLPTKGETVPSGSAETPAGSSVDLGFLKRY